MRVVIRAGVQKIIGVHTPEFGFDSALQCDWPIPVWAMNAF